MKSFIILLTLLLSLTAMGAEKRLNQNGVALCEKQNTKSDSECYDPVAYFKSKKAIKAGSGAKNFRYNYESATYVFKNKANLEEFKINPEKYAPQFGGWCAYAVAAKKDKVDIDPKSFLIQDGRLLLFYDGFFSDTRKFWQTDKNKSPQEYLKDADKNWPEVKSKANK